MDHIGERMPIQNSVKIRREPHTTGDLSEASEEDCDARHVRARRQVLRVARIANECVGRDAPQEKRRGRQTCRADHHVGLCRESLDIRCDLHLNSIGLQLRCEPA
jgi:hypothetical protein